MNFIDWSIQLAVSLHSYVYCSVYQVTESAQCGVERCRTSAIWQDFDACKADWLRQNDSQVGLHRHPSAPPLSAVIATILYALEGDIEIE